MFWKEWKNRKDKSRKEKPLGREHVPQKTDCGKISGICNALQRSSSSFGELLTTAWQ